MKKLKDILMGKGVYLIALVCVALVCTVGLYVSNLDNKDNGQNSNQDSQSETDNEHDVIANPQNSAMPTPISVTPKSTLGPSTSNKTAKPTATESQQTIKMAMPITGEIVVDYAMDKLVYSKTLEEWRTHTGVDVAGDFGAEVKAAADGKVIDVKKDPRLGCLVILEHSNGIKTVYANLQDKYAVKVGQSVKQGDLLGTIGRTSTFESKDATHLHFEVLYNDNCVNVWNYLPKK